MTSLALYVHWPYCKKICPYCNLNRYPEREHGKHEARMERAYLNQLDFLANAIPPTHKRPLTSIFFGGGSPSRMSLPLIKTILDACLNVFGIKAHAEITMEAHPLDAHRFHDFKAVGINRLSLALEALSDDGLKALDRPYDTTRARASYQHAQTLFTNLSCDFIYGRPYQTPKEWEEELSAIMALESPHLSLYELSLEGKSAFALKAQKNQLPMHDEKTQEAFFNLTHAVAAQHDYHAYELSNFARKGHQGQHNLNYWRYGDSLAIGAGGAGRMPHKDAPCLALAGIKDPIGWLNAIESGGHGYEEHVPLTKAQAATEMLLLNLRLDEGMALARFSQRCLMNFEEYCPQENLAQLASQGFLTMSDTHLKLTAKGRRLHNQVVAQLLP